MTDPELAGLAAEAEGALLRLYRACAASGADVTITETIESQDNLRTLKTPRVRISRRIYPPKEPQ